MRIRECVTVDVSPDRLWAVLEPIERHVDWMADAEAITFRGEQRRGVGTEFECRTRVGPLRLVDVMTVTEWAPGAAMGIEHRGLVRGTGRFVLTARPGGRTEFCWAEELRFPWWMGAALGAAVARPVLARIWRGNLRRLRALAHDAR